LEWLEIAGVTPDLIRGRNDVNPGRPQCCCRARCPHRAALRRRNGQDRSLQVRRGGPAWPP